MHIFNIKRLTIPKFDYKTIIIFYKNMPEISNNTLSTEKNHSLNYKLQTKTGS